MSSTKYLGQTIDCILSRSALETVKSRAGKIKDAIMEVKAIKEDYEMKAIGALYLILNVHMCKTHLSSTVHIQSIFFPASPLLVPTGKMAR